MPYLERMVWVSSESWNPSRKNMKKFGLKLLMCESFSKSCSNFRSNVCECGLILHRTTIV
uniref:Uncharacterized protein n=1 Tax=Romanomermis culicivorax TaxID=13658 RepID=A0A915JLC1_ROMCU